MTKVDSVAAFNKAVLEASVRQRPGSEICFFRRSGVDVPFARFSPLTDAAIQMDLEEGWDRGRIHQQIIGLVNFLADLFEVTIYVKVEPGEAGEDDQDFLLKNDFLKGRPFESDGGIPFCRLPKSLM